MENEKKSGEQTNINSQRDFDILINELSDCREDERACQNQIVQVISTVATILAVIFGTSYFGERDHAVQSVLFYLNCLILCTAYAYITTLGIQSVIRFHHIRNLEDMLVSGNPGKCSVKNGFVHWMSLSSSIVTKNISHIFTSLSTIMHYIMYSVSTVCMVMLGIGIVHLQYANIRIPSTLDRTMRNMTYIVTGGALGLFFYVSITARKIYRRAHDLALEKRKGRISRRDAETRQ